MVSQLATVLGSLPYEVGAILYGSVEAQSNQRQGKVSLPPLFWSAVMPDNIHYDFTIGSDEMDFAKGLLNEALTYNRVWPASGRLQPFLTMWANNDISPTLTQRSVPEWVAVVLAMQLLLDRTLTDEYQQMVQRWWSPVWPSATEKAQLETQGLAVTTPITDFSDRFNGLGRGVQFYPTVTQAKLNNRTEYLSCMDLAQTKSGTITQVYAVNGQPVQNPYQSPCEVDVAWSDGTSERVSYLMVRSLDPVLGTPLETRAQNLLSGYDMGVGGSMVRPDNDLINKMAGVLVLAALDSRSGLTMLPEAIVKRWSYFAGFAVQPAAQTQAYQRMTDSSGMGLSSVRGQTYMAQMFDHLRGKFDDIQGLGGLVSNFLDIEEVFTLGSVRDSGLVVCPECRYCETIAEATWVDFGYQGWQDGVFTSVKWSSSGSPYGEATDCVGVVRCGGCSQEYYRLFRPLVQPFEVQVPTLVPRSLRPDFSIDSSSRGGSAGEGQIRAYSFMMPHRHGTVDSSSADALPQIRLWAEFQGRIRADDIPVEVGTQSRNLRRVKFCSGRSVEPTTNSPSHKYYDNYLASPKGTGQYSGLNKTNFNTVLGNQVCGWCASVASATSAEVPTTLVEGSYFRGDTSFLTIEREGGGRQFDRPDIDFVGSGGETFDITFDDGSTQSFTTPIVVDYYRIRLVGNDRTRILEIEPDQVGLSIPVVGGISTRIADETRICPNEKMYYYDFARKLYEEFLKAKADQEGGVGRFLLTDQLAYSARFNEEEAQWEAATPNNSNSWFQQKNLYDEMFNKVGSTLSLQTEWTAGNPDARGQPRFPDPLFGQKSAVAIMTPYTDNFSTRSLPLYHGLDRVGQDVDVQTAPDGTETRTVTPFWHCQECENSYHGAPTDYDGEMFKLPNRVGDEFLRPDETERRDDGGGGYSSSKNWHFLLPLYPPNSQAFENEVKNKPAEYKQVFPQELLDWLLNNKQFPTSSEVSATGGDVGE